MIRANNLRTQRVLPQQMHHPQRQNYHPNLNASEAVQVDSDGSTLYGEDNSRNRVFFPFDPVNTQRTNFFGISNELSYVDLRNASPYKKKNSGGAHKKRRRKTKKKGKRRKTKRKNKRIKSRSRKKITKKRRR